MMVWVALAEAVDTEMGEENEEETFVCREDISKKYIKW